MKFRYIIIDDFSMVTGTNDRDKALERYGKGDMVIDAHEGITWEETDEEGSMFDKGEIEEVE